MVYFRIIFTVLSLVMLSSCSQDSKSSANIYGQIEAKEIDVSSRISARVKKILVQPGQFVKSGEVLVEFEDDIIAARRERAEATIKAAESTKEMTDNAVRPEERRQAEAAVKVSLKQRQLAKTTLDRMQILLKEGAISQQTYDEAQFAYDAAREKYEADLAKLQLARLGARKEQKDAAQAVLKQAETALSEVVAYDTDLKLTAPMDGEVIDVLNEIGELVPTGYPVVTLVEKSSPWSTFHVSETKLSSMKVGQSVKIQVPALNMIFDGKITHISPLGYFANFTGTQERSSFDLKTFDVRTTLTGDLSKLRPGMTAILKN